VSCGSAPLEARPDGSCDLDVPAAAEPGRYEVRFFADDGYAALASTAVAVEPPAGAAESTVPSRRHTDPEA
jgi:hypothetical protein